MTRIKTCIAILILIASAHCGPFGKLNAGLNLMKQLPRFTADISKSFAKEFAHEAQKSAHSAQSIFEKIKHTSQNQAEKMAEDIKRQSEKIQEFVMSKINDAFAKSNEAFSKAGNFLKLFSEVMKHQTSSESRSLVPENKQPSNQQTSEEKTKAKENEKKESSEKTIKEETKETTKSEQEPEQSKPEEKQQKAPEITPEVVQEINKQRGVGVVGEDYHSIIAKLASPQTRTSLIRGFFKKSTSDMKLCQPVYEEIGSLMPIFIQLMTANSNQESIMLTLNSKVRMESMMKNLNANSEYKECFNVEETHLRIFLLKMLLDSATFIEKGKVEEKVWEHLGNAMASFNLGAVEAAGSSIAQAVKVASAIKVNISDELLEKVNFWTCADTILKTKRSQPVTSNLLNDWHRAAADSITICLNSANN